MFSCHAACSQKQGLCDYSHKSEVRINGFLVVLQHLFVICVCVRVILQFEVRLQVLFL